MDRFIGMDVHAASTTFAVIDARGKRLHSKVVETNGSALIEFLQREPGTLHLCLEEGTQSTWLVEILSAHVKRIVVAHVSESRGHKSDERDAFALAEMLRTDAIKTVVYKHTGAFASLRLLVKAHTAAVRDTVRAQNRLKALFRSHGVEMSGANPYGAKHREERIVALPETARPSARVMFAHYDALQIAREHAESMMVEESHRHPISRVLETCPGLGPIRVAQLVSVVITPERFRTRAQFWAYCGLGVVMRSSSDWVRESGGWRRARALLSLRGNLRTHGMWTDAHGEFYGLDVAEHFLDTLMPEGCPELRFNALLDAVEAIYTAAETRATELVEAARGAGTLAAAFVPRRLDTTVRALPV